MTNRPVASNAEWRMVAIFAAIVLLASAQQALLGEVVRFEITERAPFAESASFGAVGPYEKIRGRVHFAIDPQRRQNAAIVDLQYAQRNATGRVEFSADLLILAPVDLSKGNGAVFYEVNNRGNIRLLRDFNEGGGGNDPSIAQHAGNGFLMRRGFTLVFSGWDGELLGGSDRLRLTAPVARDGDQPILGLVRYEFVPEDDNVQRINVSQAMHGAYPPNEINLDEATLSMRRRPPDARQPIDEDDFTIHITPPDPPLPGQLPLIEVSLIGGFKKGHIHELIYESTDPLVHGVCFAAVRDLVSALKYGGGQDNPLTPTGARPFRYAYGFGVSQSGRFLREFLYGGFNEDETGRIVFDGLWPHVAGAGLGSFNHRFAHPTQYASQFDKHDFPSDRFPFAYQTMRDPNTGRTDGLLRAATATRTAPKVFHTVSSVEYWSRANSLVHTDALGRLDGQLPPNVRLWTFGSTQHVPSAFPPKAGSGKQPANPADYRPFLRALLIALDAWCRDDTTPPPSVYPTLASGALIDAEQNGARFPRIPGLDYPQVIHQPLRLNWGDRWLDEGIIDEQPPIMQGRYNVLVPRSDQDGNDSGCLLPPEVAVPLATYTGWNLRNADSGAENELVGLAGSYVPFPLTEAERAAQRDPRTSIQQRYGSLEAYMQKVDAYCRTLIEQRYLLEEDVTPLMNRLREQAAPMFETAAAPTP